MAKPIVNAPQSPEEFQRQLSDFVRQHFQNLRSSPPASEPASSARPQETTISAEEFKFDYKPKQIKEYLDRFVIKQEEAKKVLSVALCDHYHHVRLALEGKESPNYAKQNVIFFGPPGVGKHFLIGALAVFIGFRSSKPKA